MIVPADLQHFIFCSASKDCLLVVAHTMSRYGKEILKNANKDAHNYVAFFVPDGAQPGFMVPGWVVSLRHKRHTQTKRHYILLDHRTQAMRKNRPRTSSCINLLEFRAQTSNVLCSQSILNPSLRRVFVASPKRTAGSRRFIGKLLARRS